MLAFFLRNDGSRWGSRRPSLGMFGANAPDAQFCCNPFSFSCRTAFKQRGPKDAGDPKIAEIGGVEASQLFVRSCCYEDDDVAARGHCRQ